MRTIDADAMLVRLEEWNTSDPTDKALYNFTLNRIQEQPTIEPQRKTGKWIYTPTEPLGYICSECKKGCCRYDFCPNCGSYNEGENDDIPDDIPIEYFESGGK